MIAPANRETEILKVLENFQLRYVLRLEAKNQNIRIFFCGTSDNYDKLMTHYKEDKDIHCQPEEPFYM